MPKQYKIHEYKGFKIQNNPYRSEARWFIYKEDMTQLEKTARGSLKECKEFLDRCIENKGLR